MTAERQKDGETNRMINRKTAERQRNKQKDKKERPLRDRDKQNDDQKDH